MVSTDHVPPVALVVEDEQALRHLAATVLEETGLRIIEAVSAEEALHLLRNHTEEVTFVFVNIRLPYLMNGVELAHRLAARWPKIKLLITSADPDDLREKHPPGSSFIRKPWLVLDILREAERALAERCARSGSRAQPDRLSQPRASDSSRSRFAEKTDLTAASITEP